MSFTLCHTPARQAVAADEALLDQPGQSRFWLAEAPAVAVGLGLHHRLDSIVDLDRCQRLGVDVIPRRAGGGALLLSPDVICGAISLPTDAISRDITESYRWLGQLLVDVLRTLGLAARSAEVAEARADVAALRGARSGLNKLLLDTCYGALSPHEVVVDTQAGPAKLVGLAQVRRRDVALFQFGVLLRDQSPLADFLCVESEADRESSRAALARRTIGLAALTSRSASEVAEAIAGARPFAR